MAKRIVVTGVAEEARAFGLRIKKVRSKAELLPIALSTIRIEKKPLSASSKTALANLSHYDYVIFTSAHAVHFFASAIKELRVKKPHSIRVVAVGPSTAHSAQEVGFKADTVPKEFNAHAIVKSLRAKDTLHGKRILFPTSTLASPLVSNELRAAGAIVKVIPLYTTIPIRANTKIFHAIFNSTVDCIIFLSPSSVAGFSKNLRKTILKERVLATPTICIGPTSAKAASEAGFKKIGISEQSITDSIIRKLRASLS